jgi:transposase-like protein
MARREYTEETKAAVMAALLAGQSVSSAAQEYKIPKGTVSDWRRAATAKIMPEGVVEEPTQKGTSLDQLLLSYVETNLETLRAQSEFFRGQQWLSRQQASELAVLHGVIADKTIRILEAYGNAGGAS